MANRVVTQIRPRPSLPQLQKELHEKRVAAYARVSTDSDEQMGSVEAQKDYFEKLIREHPGWVLVGIYADEGIPGTSLMRREAFNRMVDDAVGGKIDLIITKSLSRFARNTVDALNVIRKLKGAGVGVYFEKENIDTLDSKGEFLITLMSSLAEEESRSISENVKWGQRKRFSDGRYSLPYKQFLGYKKGEDGTPEMVEDEAKIVRIIYRLFLNGYSSTAIAKKLTDAGIPTPARLDVWQRATIESILQNEKYHGAALLQKQFCVDFRTKKMVPNRGELPMYYVEKGHEPIVTKEIFDEVQRRFQRRPWRGHSTTHIFSHKLYCGDCGGLFGPLIAHSTTCHDMAWNCSNRRLRKYPCATPLLYEEMLKPIFHEIIMYVLQQNAGIVRECIAALKGIGVSGKVISKNTVMDAVSGHNTSSETEYRIWRSIIQKVVVHPGHLLEYHIVDGAIVPYQMLKTSPRQSRLTQATKTKILQAHSMGQSPAAIAKELNIPSSTVRSLISRSKKRAKRPAFICQNCGKSFAAYDYQKRKYCSQNCYRVSRFYGSSKCETDVGS